MPDTPMFTFQVNLRNVCDNIPDVARTASRALDHKERPGEKRRAVNKKSVTVDLQALMVEKYLREKVNRRTLLVERLQKINSSIQIISESLSSVAAARYHYTFSFIKCSLIHINLCIKGSGTV